MKLLLEIANKSPSNSEIQLTPSYVITKINNDDLCTIGERLWEERMKYLDLE